MKLHHIGYLVKNIDKSLNAFRSLGYVPVSLCGQGDVMYDEYRKCDIAFMIQRSFKETNDRSNNIGAWDGEEGLIELISPKTSESPIWGLMSKYKNTPYHLCFESNDLDADISNLKNAGWSVFQPAAVAPAIGGRQVVFLIHRNAGIIELVGINYDRKNETIPVRI